MSLKGFIVHQFVVSSFLLPSARSVCRWIEGTFPFKDKIPLVWKDLDTRRAHD